MKLQDRRAAFTDLFFALGLFCVFTACALLLVTIGLRAYRGTVTQMQDTYSTRTALAYVTEKVRQHDTAGAVCLTELEGAPALRLTDTVGESEYYTYIYADDSHLYELTLRAGAEPTRALGEPILEVQDFAVRDAGGGFWSFSAAGSGGETMQCLVHLRSAAA